MSHTEYKTVDLDGYEMFYREAGKRGNPTLLLLHGYPTSSHMFRDLMMRLSDEFHVVAPDFPGFGRSARPPREHFEYTFAHAAELTARLTEALGLERYAVYLFDYGAPIGLRMALRDPERITALISQNGNAYEEGLSDGWAPYRAYWSDPSDANRNALRGMLSEEKTRWQYEEGVPDLERLSPDGWNLDAHYMERPGVDEIQLDLMLDYGTNVAMYPDFHRYFRESRPPLLAIWGDKDPFFLPPGAEAFKRDLPDADVRFLDTGHFAIETHVDDIAEAIRAFLKQHRGS